ncbi:MAG: ATP-binding protein [Chloroflexi bacterium]|nr:ATP-binding protein [Chloroflexota bacterium]
MHGKLRFPATLFTQSLQTSKLLVANCEEEMKARLTHLVRERCIGVIIGEVGSGKSTAVRAFVEGLEPSQYTVVHATNPLVGSTGFYREVLGILGEPVPMFRQQMVLAIRRTTWRELASRSSGSSRRTNEPASVFSGAPASGG